MYSGSPAAGRRHRRGRHRHSAVPRPRRRIGELVEQVRHDRNVVRREIPDDVAVVLVSTETQTCGVDVENPTQFARLNDLLELPDRRVVLKGVAHHQRGSALVGGLHHRLRDRYRRRKRLLDKGVQPRPQRPQRNGAMGAWGVAMTTASKSFDTSLRLSATRTAGKSVSLAEPVRSTVDDRDVDAG